LLKFAQGQYSAAATDFDDSSRLSPANGYRPVWRYLARIRSDDPVAAKEELEKAAAARIDTTWPTPLIELFLGRADIAAVRKATDTADAIRRRGQVCEADFFIGELHLQNQQPQEALALLNAAQDGCPPDYVEAYAAAAELKRLGSPVNAALPGAPAASSAR
jgi:lipoprotein NlpI